jgi:hypothetical protein
MAGAPQSAPGDCRRLSRLRRHANNGLITAEVWISLVGVPGRLGMNARCCHHQILPDR